MAQTKYTCKDCVLLNDEDSEFPYCMGKDLYTDANPDDDACGDIIPLVYTCKDCFFFKDDICHNTTEKRYIHRKRILLAGISSTKRLLNKIIYSYG